METPGQIVSYKESVEKVMQETNDHRKSEIYKHDKEDCSEDCKKKRVWQYCFCGRSLEITIQHLHVGTNKKISWTSEYVPNTCSLQPGDASAFCDHHHCEMRVSWFQLQLK